MGNILLRDQDGYIVAFEQFDCRSFARFPGKEVRATVLTYIDPFSCNRRNERCPPNYRSGRCRITRATGGSSTCFDNVHIVRELAIELWNLYNFQFRFGVKIYECEYLCQVIVCLHAASAMYINLDCNINVRSHLIFYFLSFLFFFLVSISWNRWKKVEETRMCNDLDKFANNKHLPVNEHIHIDTDRGLRFHYRIQSVSCFLFQFLINHISCSCVFNHRRLQRKDSSFSRVVVSRIQLSFASSFVCHFSLPPSLLSPPVLPLLRCCFFCFSQPVDISFFPFFQPV